MKFISSILIAFLLLVGCGTGHENMPAHPTGFQEGSEVEIPSLHNGLYAVNIKVVLFNEHKDCYPITRAAFDVALQQWAEGIPVIFHILEIDGSQAYEFRGRRDIIQIHIIDFDSPEYMMSDTLYGLWEPEKARILLNGSILEEEPMRALGVSLHEIGHLLGIPHIVNHNENPYTGYISLKEGFDAQELVMYPAGTPEPRISLSYLELKLGHDNLVNYWGNVNKMLSNAECSLELTENH